MPKQASTRPHGAFPFARYHIDCYCRGGGGVGIIKYSHCLLFLFRSLPKWRVPRALLMTEHERCASDCAIGQFDAAESNTLPSLSTSRGPTVLGRLPCLGKGVSKRRQTGSAGRVSRVYWPRIAGWLRMARCSAPLLALRCRKAQKQTKQTKERVDMTAEARTTTGWSCDLKIPGSSSAQCAVRGPNNNFPRCCLL